MTFAIGQPVICIRHFKGRAPFNRPQFMQIYHVRAYSDASATPSILLCELHNPEVCFVTTLKYGEASFAEEGFRALEPLQDERAKAASA